MPSRKPLLSVSVTNMEIINLAYKMPVRSKYKTSEQRQSNRKGGTFVAEQDLLQENDRLEKENAGLRRELDWLRRYVELDRSSIEAAERERSRLRSIREKDMFQSLQEKSAMLMAENKKLLQYVTRDEDAEYWIGLTEDPDRTEIRLLRAKVDRLENKVHDLETDIKTKNRAIGFLRKQLTDICYPDGDPFAGTSLEVPDPASDNPAIRPGRPSVSTVGSEIEARKMRKQGMTVREIAERMDWSVGKVQKVTGSVKIDESARKEHMKQRAKSPKKRK